MNDVQRRLVAGFDRVASERRLDPVPILLIPPWLEKAAIEAGISIPTNAVALHGLPPERNSKGAFALLLPSLDA